MEVDDWGSHHSFHPPPLSAAGGFKTFSEVAEILGVGIFQLEGGGEFVEIVEIFWDEAVRCILLQNFLYFWAFEGLPHISRNKWWQRVDSSESTYLLDGIR